MSVFHRVDDPLELPSSRFFRMAQRLPLRGGAVSAAVAEAQTDREPWPREEVHPSSQSSGMAEGTADDIAAMAAMSQNPGFPGIGYSGG